MKSPSKVVIWYEDNGVIHKRVETNKTYIKALLDMKASLGSNSDIIKIKVIK